MEELEEQLDTEHAEASGLAIDLQAVINLIRWDVEEAAKEFTNSNIERTIYGEDYDEDEEETEEEDDDDDVEQAEEERVNESEEDVETVRPVQAPANSHVIQSDIKVEVKSAVENIDRARLHMMQKMNFIDKMANRPPSYPGVEIPANFSYYTREQMDYLVESDRQRRSFRYRFLKSFNRFKGVALYYLKHALFVIVSAAVTTIAYYWYVSLKPWENWLDFYVWGFAMIGGIMGSFFITQLSPSQTFAKYATVTFYGLNMSYWLYFLWSQANVSEHLIYFSVATFMTVLTMIIISVMTFNKD